MGQVLVYRVDMRQDFDLIFVTEPIIRKAQDKNTQSDR